MMSASGEMLSTEDNRRDCGLDDGRRATGDSGERVRQMQCGMYVLRLYRCVTQRSRLMLTA